MRKTILIFALIVVSLIGQEAIKKEVLGTEQLIQKHKELTNAKANIDLQLKQIEFAYNYLIAMEAQKDTVVVEEE